MRPEEVVSFVHSADFARVIEVWEASVRATHHFVTEADIQVFRPLVWDGLRDVEHLLAIRDGEERVVGFIGVEGDEVAMLFVHPDWRGQGIGRRLLTHAVVALGAMRLDVNEQNEQALGFYRRMGFTVVGRSKRDYTDKPYPLLHLLRLTKPRLKQAKQNGCEPGDRVEVEEAARATLVSPKAVNASEEFLRVPRPARR
jgi:putative acetyltransferase